MITGLLEDEEDDDEEEEEDIWTQNNDQLTSKLVHFRILSTILSPHLIPIFMILLISVLGTSDTTLSQSDCDW